MVPVFNTVEERSTARKYCPVSILSAVSTVFEKLLNNRFIDINMAYDFQYGFRSLEVLDGKSSQEYLVNASQEYLVNTFPTMH